ncbi:vegetative cell wall protein gp1 [Puntigrus tetrazona]|uniref:vegetative cell wall protein gp1 n=1 Tax=Puntigrus tetrazona TaxID=1606681 RepID=UPI001C89E140|nr:vegetative cell wall protein gp1 [Puntigrus tetrazona]
MKSATPVKMLAAFALLLLVFSGTEGRIMNKCELKAKLDAAQLQQITVMEETITVKSLIARFVCKANTSAFNTSFVKNITAQNNEMNPAQASQAPSSGGPPQAPAGSPHKDAPSGSPHKVPTSRAPPKVPTSRDPPKVSTSRDPPKVPTSRSPPKVPSFGSPPKVPTSRAPPKDPSSRLPPHDPTGAPPKPDKSALTKRPEGSSYETKQPHPSAAGKVVGHLYGVFQLSDQVACDSGTIPSLNVCNITCSALTDDDISNDIACLKTLTNVMKMKPKETPFDVKKIVDMMLVKECQSVPSNYFAGCV